MSRLPAARHSVNSQVSYSSLNVNKHLEETVEQHSDVVRCLYNPVQHSNYVYMLNASLTWLSQQHGGSNTFKPAYYSAAATPFIAISITLFSLATCGQLHRHALLNLYWLLGLEHSQPMN